MSRTCCFRCYFSLSHCEFFCTGKYLFLLHFMFSIIISWEEKESWIPFFTEASKVYLLNRENRGFSEALHYRLTNYCGDDVIRSAVRTNGAGAQNYYLRGSRAAVRPRHNGEIPGRRGASDGSPHGKQKSRRLFRRHRRAWQFAILRAMTLAGDEAPALSRCAGDDSSSG